MNNIRFLRLVNVTSLIAVVSMSCFSIFFLTPSFTDLVIKNAASESVKVAHYLSEPFQKMDKVTRDLPDAFAESARQAVADFKLMKIKVFAPDGETVYSSSEEDISKMNENDYFHNIVAKGEVLTKVVQKNTRSLEDQIVSADVVETYVPVMNAGNFTGAFEVYLDITDNKNDLETLLFKSNSLMLLIAAGLLISIFFISLVARRSFIKQEEAEKKINQQSLALWNKNSELLKINEELDLILNFVPGIICTAGTDGYFKTVNPAMEKTLGFSKEELLSKPLFDFIHPEDKNPDKTEIKMRVGERRIRRFQNRYVCKNGSYRLLEWYTTSAVDGILYATARDITEQKKAEEEREKLIGELQKALDEIKSLHGIIPICNRCKKIRNDQGAWDRIEAYLSEHTDAQLRQGTCPSCHNIIRRERMKK